MRVMYLCYSNISKKLKLIIIHFSRELMFSFTNTLSDGEIS